MKNIIILTKDNKLLLSKDETSDNLIVDNSIEVEYIWEELIVKLLKDYDNEWNVEVTDNWDILIK